MQKGLKTMVPEAEVAKASARRIRSGAFDAIGLANSTLAILSQRAPQNREEGRELRRGANRVANALLADCQKRGSLDGAETVERLRSFARSMEPLVDTQCLA